MSHAGPQTLASGISSTKPADCPDLPRLLGPEMLQQQERARAWPQSRVLACLQSRVVVQAGTPQQCLRQVAKEHTKALPRVG